MAKTGKKQRSREAKAARRKAEKQQMLISRSLWVGLPILLVAGLIAFGLYRQANAPAFDPLAGLRDANIEGNIDAPVTILEFGDFG